MQSHILHEIDRLHQPSMQQAADALAMDIPTFSRQIQTLAKLNLVKKFRIQKTDAYIFYVDELQKG